MARQIIRTGPRSGLRAASLPLARGMAVGATSTIAAVPGLAARARAEAAVLPAPVV